MNLSDHAEHVWSQQGRCVWCDDCGIRLYQGKLPARGEQKEHATDIDNVLAPLRKKVEEKSKKAWEERTPEQNAAFEEGRASYVPGESIMDRMKRGNPYKGTDLAAWHNRGWQNAENDYYQWEAQS